VAEVDASIPLQVKQPADYNQTLMSALQSGEAMQNLQGQKAMKEAFQNADMNTPEGQQSLIKKVGSVNPGEAMKLQGQFQNQAKTKSEITKNEAITQKTQMENAHALFSQMDDAGSILMYQFTDLVQNKGMSPQDAARVVSSNIPPLKAHLAQQRFPDGRPMFSQEQLAQMPNEFDPQKFAQMTMSARQMKEKLDYEMNIRKEKNTERHQGVLEKQGAQRIGLEGARVGMEGQRLGMEGTRLGMEQSRLSMTEAKDGLMPDPEHKGKYIKDPTSGLQEDDLKFMARQYLAGDKSVLQNLGRGQQGAKDIVALRKYIRTEAEAKGMKPDEVASTIAEFEGLKAGERTLGTRTATAGMAVTEATQFADLAVKSSEKVNRTSYPSFNKILLAGEKGTGDKDIVQFGAYNNSLINAYARAISPSGTPTVSDKDHAREMLDTAYSKGQYAAVVDAMKKEMAAAMKSPGMVREEFRGYGKRKIGPDGGASTPGKQVGTMHWDDLK
jgi:hypothetical protein